MKSLLFHLPRFGFAPDSMGWSFFGNPSGLGEGRSIRGSGRFHIIFQCPKKIITFFQGDKIIKRHTSTLFY